MASPELLTPVPGAPTALRAGGLLWAFHDGFTAYVARLADGRIDVDGGARLQADGRVLFPFRTTAEGQELRGSGAVHFTGHHGLLAVTLADPAVVETEGTALLTIADPFAPGRRMVFAALGLAGPGAAPSTVRYAEPLLAEDGADLFLGHYHEGTPLAPLDVFPAPAPADQDARDD